MTDRLTSPERCRTKRAYGRRKAAQVAASRLLRKAGRAMVVYRCNVCGLYHVAKRI